MFKYFKNLEHRKPIMLLNLYSVLSLIVLMCCIVTIAFMSTFNYIKNERARSTISFQQLENFFVFNYRPMAEELWTGNYESVAMRISDISKKFGNAQFSFYILDSAAHCLASSANGHDLNQNCETPGFIKKAFLNPGNSDVSSHKLVFDLKLNKYIYFTPLNIEPQKVGYIYVEMSDPYNFYRGSLFSKLLSDFFIKLIIMVVIWLVWLLVSKKLILKPYFTLLNKAEKKEALGALAAQVAHDIQSPLAAFEMIIQASREISEDKRVLIRSAVGRIRDIANNLLVTHKESMSTGSAKKYAVREAITCQFAASLLENIITEKRMQYRNNIKITIVGFLDYEESYSLFVRVQLSNFKRVISNIVNNSVEAIADKGKVSLTLKQRNNNIEIIIQDDGVGIAPDLLKKLGRSIISYGKLNGHGLGIFHAKEILSNCGGRLLIESELNKGTTVKIILPKAEEPKWFISELKISPNTVVCIIDDDESMHYIWKKRLSDLSSKCKSLLINHFSCPKELISWHQQNMSHGRVLYLCDHDFLEKDINGVELIQKLGINSQSILVTSHYEEQGIQEYCAQNNVKLIPKSMAAFIPLKIAYEN